MPQPERQTDRQAGKKKDEEMKKDKAETERCRQTEGPKDRNKNAKQTKYAANKRERRNQRDKYRIHRDKQTDIC